jgi:hypothetical protein
MLHANIMPITIHSMACDTSFVLPDDSHNTFFLYCLLSVSKSSPDTFVYISVLVFVHCPFLYTQHDVVWMLKICCKYTFFAFAANFGFLHKHSKTQQIVSAVGIVELLKYFMSSERVLAQIGTHLALKSDNEVCPRFQAGSALKTRMKPKIRRRM